MFSIKGYSTAQTAEICRTEANTLTKARATAWDLKRRGFIVEIRDSAGKIVSDDFSRGE